MSSSYIDIKAGYSIFKTVGCGLMEGVPELNCPLSYVRIELARCKWVTTK